MFSKLKLIWKALFAFKNVAKEYKEAGEEKVPVYLHRRFIHSVLVAFSVAITYFIADFSVEESMLDTITDNMVTIGTSVTTLWGVIGVIIGQLKKNK